MTSDLEEGEGYSRDTVDLFGLLSGSIQFLLAWRPFLLATATLWNPPSPAPCPPTPYPVALAWSRTHCV